MEPRKNALIEFLYAISELLKDPQHAYVIIVTIVFAIAGMVATFFFNNQQVGFSSILVILTTLAAWLLTTEYEKRAQDLRKEELRQEELRKLEEEVRKLALPVPAGFKGFFLNRLDPANPISHFLTLFQWPKRKCSLSPLRQFI